MNKMQLNMIKEDCQKIIDGLGNDIYKLEGRNILITGANGMLASFFVDTIILLNEKYLDKPCKIIAVIRSELNENSRLFHTKNDPNIKFLIQDVSKKFEITDKIDYIIHAASKAAPKHYLDNPLDTINSNLNGLVNLLEYSKKNKIEGLLYFSSSEIYGTPDNEFIPTSEKYPGKILCTSPRACYTETKRFCETILVNYSKQYNIPAKIVRPWHVFGIGMRLDDSRVIGDFINDGLNNRDIMLLSDGLSTRTFCYITDAHIGFWKVLFSNYNAEAFNIGNNEPEIRIRDLAKMICNLYENKISYSYKQEEVDYVKGSPQRCCPDIKKAKQLLSYEPKEKLENWLSRMISFYS